MGCGSFVCRLGGELRLVGGLVSWLVGGLVGRPSTAP